MNYSEIILAWITENIVSIGAFIATLLVFYILKAVVIHKLRKLAQRTKNDIDDLVVDILKTLRLAFAAVLGLIISFSVAEVSIDEMKILSVFFVAIATYQVARIIGVLFDFGVKKVGNQHGPAAVQGLKTVVNIFIWIGGSLFIMTILGYNVNSIIAGLGIGGIAVALAVQNILSDVLSSFSIYFDRPFTVGDYIEVGEIEGTVEKIGMKTTRLRSISGEEIILSNKYLTESVVGNFGRLKRRRIKMMLGVVYETSNEKLEKIPSSLMEIINAVEKAEFQRAYFKSFGDFSLDFELSYFFNSSNFDEFVAARHQINLEIKRWFEDQDISFAYPTETVYQKRLPNS